MHRLMKKDKSLLIKTRKIRSRFALGFFVIIFPFFFLILGIIFILEKNGISLNKVSSPIFVTFIIGFLCVILGYLISYMLMTDIFHPLEQLSDASKKIATGNYEAQINYQGHIEEIGNTIENFNFMAQELNSVEIMRNDFIANVSHEFKTPLASVTGYVMLLQDSELSEEERMECIQMLLFNIEKLNDLSGNILQLSKLENQTTLPSPVGYRLDEQIREAIVLLEPKWNKKHITFNLELQEITYTGQPALLFQVWTNLIGNAIKFSHSDSVVTVILRTYHEDIEAIISDNGIGISEKALPHIFEKFYQGDSSRQEQGNGLGLPLCKKILDLCGGKIYVSSKPDEGTTFMVKL